MKSIELIFWLLIGLIFYSYVGYGIVLFLMVHIKRLFNKPTPPIDTVYEPEVTLLIAAYNERDYVERKVRNSRLLNYPREKLKQVWVTDGSDDGTPDLLSVHTDVKVLHQPERRGKIAAITRAIKRIHTPIVVFSDANTDISAQAIRRMVDLFRDPQTGGVAGEKRIVTHKTEDAATAGESIYWKYESTLKRWDAELNSAVGAAGELFAIRTELFQEPEADTLLDDFMIAMRITMKGYAIKYDPEAYAIERASANVTEELKRKVRIAAGGIQSVLRLLPLLNVFKYKLLSFQYISHRVLRWIPAPFALIAVFILNLLMVHENSIYPILLMLQISSYAMAFIGWLTERQKIRVKLAFIPYYFVMMNYAMLKGFVRYFHKTQSVNWERARRQS
ncbi:MAG: glycosyltransferase family 2 protein [Marinilabiliaceae bacterium]|nr:glycosyltransferase family 2 protein [Marinilabiliaceae bacterium]